MMCMKCSYIRMYVHSLNFEQNIEHNRLEEREKLERKSKTDLTLATYVSSMTKYFAIDTAMYICSLVHKQVSIYSIQ